LFKAIQNNDLAKLKKDIFLGADINAKNESGDTLIISAVKLDRYECFNYLLHAGADIYIRDRYGQNVIDLITENHKYEYLLAVARAGYRIANCKDQLMEWIANGEPILKPADDIDPVILAEMEKYFCKIASSLHYYYGPKIVSYQRGGIILDLLGSAIITIHYQDGNIVAAVTTASPVHPKPFPNQNIKTGSWYTMTFGDEENIIAIQAGLIMPYTRGDMIALIDSLHDEVIELYLEASKGGQLNAL